MGELEGRVALVTGAARGIGASIADALAQAGARVAVTDVDGDAAQATAAALPDGRGTGYRLDVASSAEADAVVDAVVAEHGGLDILVNNAGISLVGPSIVETSDEHWQRTLDVMQTGVFHCLRAAGRRFIEQRSGVCVNISSIRGFSPRAGRLSYSTTKAAVIMMTKIAALEWAPYGVRCNAIAPGVQRTPMWDEDVALGVVDEERVLATTPLHRLGDPAEIGGLVRYLVSDAASFITGEVITIDGGLTLVPPDGEALPAAPDAEA
ncbi:SDR family NAD(P)-dependent oxidoreductase [Jiangella anatolica]|uniref:SDR family NAD(P)-dependent oxidoreductase n=1 Tax=Jiangella anatolica TaxID=2670374 RepID=UPI0013141C29|nr:SDR family NAD(P)-dependent oxidoreductase [Jiangella anatolica]